MANVSQSRFSMVPSSAVCDERLSHLQLRVLLAIGSFTSKDKAAYPKQRTIADLLGVSRETVNRAIKVLRELGYVSVEHQQRDDGGQRESLYWVNLDPRDANVTAPVIEADPCDDEITPPVTAYDHTPCDAIGSHLRTPHKNIPTVADATVVPASAEAVSAEQPNPQKGKGKVRGVARKTSLPDNWTPSIATLAFASQRGLTRQEINHETDTFRNDAKSKGKQFIDWDAAFRTWLGNTVKWKAEREARRPAYQRGGAEQTLSAFDRVAASLAGHAPRTADPVQPDAGTIEGEYWPAETRTGTSG